MSPKTAGIPEGAPRYQLRTVADFLAVPMDRLDVCLEEFGVCLAMVHLSRAVAPQTTLGSFEWIDDGKREVVAKVEMTHHDPAGVPSSGGGGTT